MGSEKNGFLGETNVSNEHIQAAFREHFKDQELAVNVDKAETVAVGQGFTSNIVRLTLKWTSTGGQKSADLPQTVILKAPAAKAMEELWKNMTLEQDTDKINHFMNQAHNGECVLYRTFLQHRPTPVTVPLVYATWDSQTATSNDRPLMILMEDLGARARVLGDPTDNLNYEQLRSVIAGLADIQAWSLRNPHMIDAFEDIEQRYEGFKEFEAVMINGVKNARVAHPTIFETIDEEKLLRYIQHDYMITLYREQAQRFPSVLVHGDCWANNIMFEKLPDGSMGPKIVAFIDWQMSMKGSMGMDFSRVLSINCSPDLQEQKYEEFKKYYFDLLTEKVGSENMPKHLTWEAVSEMLDQSTAQNSLMMLFMQDVMQHIFVSGDGPENEKKKERLIARCRYGMQFAAKILDIRK